MKKLWICATLLALFAMPAQAGVVFEVETTDHGGSSRGTTTTQAYIEGKNLRIEIAAGRGSSESEALYRGDRREMVVVDHGDKTYRVIDQQTMAEIAGQVNSAMSQIEEALKNVPEDQRAMVEQMMKQRMPQAAAPRRPAAQLRRTGERATHAGYPCVKYEVLRDGRKIREMWVTDWSNVEGGTEAVDAFEGMAEFFQELLDSIPDFGGGSGSPMDDNPFVHMRDIGGFPVVTREFDEDGSLESESTLRSSQRRTLDPAEFEPPAGYKRREMFPS